MMVALRRRRAVLPKAADIDMVRKVHEMKFLSRTKILLAAVIAVMLMTTCAFASEIEKVHPYYPAAKMKKTVKTGGITIRSGERVIVVKKGGSASLVKYKGKKYKVKASSYRIDGWNTRSKKRYSNATAEHFVNSKGYSSKTNYLIWVSTYTQQLTAAYRYSPRSDSWSCCCILCCLQSVRQWRCYSAFWILYSIHLCGRKMP